jgi:hypothetical protein
VVAGLVPYSLTVEASVPLEVTTMHLVPVEPGFRPVAVKSAVLESSSASATVPTAQLLAGLVVLAVNAEYEAGAMMRPLTTRATGSAAHFARRAVRRLGAKRCDAVWFDTVGFPPIDTGGNLR